MGNLLQQEMFASSDLVEDALEHFGEASAHVRGAIHTRPEVCEFILDLVGWKVGEIDRKSRLLEPAAGHGDFLEPAVRRLLAQERSGDLVALADRIVGIEVNTPAVKECRDRIRSVLTNEGWLGKDADFLCKRWIRQADFLTCPISENFTHIVGNPPYLRVEDLPKTLLRAYRSMWVSLYDRADLYVAFIERSLRLLAPSGRLSFICADRWMRNRYGTVLRGLVSDGFQLEICVDFTECPAFETPVDAYPAVFVIRPGRGSVTRTYRRPEISRSFLCGLAKRLTAEVPSPDLGVIPNVVSGRHPWILDAADRAMVLKDLESRLPLIEEVGCRIGIGVATGADSVFIGTDTVLDVESDRRLRMVGTEDIRSGRLEWTGRWVLNPYDAQGGLVDLKQYPRLASYFRAHETVLRGRHVAIRNPVGWYRTIDPIHLSLVETPKLLIPDIKGSAHVVLDPGGFYPHHNLYFVVSSEWPLPALREVLQSRIATGFVSLYCPPLRGGFLRFQAQYLRRIRLPLWRRLPKSTQLLLVSGDVEECEAGIREAFGLSTAQWKALAQG